MSEHATAHPYTTLHRRNWLLPVHFSLCSRCPLLKIENSGVIKLSKTLFSLLVVYFFMVNSVVQSHFALFTPNRTRNVDTRKLQGGINTSQQCRADGNRECLCNFAVDNAKLHRPAKRAHVNNI